LLLTVLFTVLTAIVHLLLLFAVAIFWKDVITEAEAS
jgi:hypothetical protein